MWEKVKMAWANEPIVIINSVMTVIQAVIVMLVAFGLDISEEQKGSIIAVSVAIGGIITALYGRSQVTPNAKVNQ